MIVHTPFAFALLVIPVVLCRTSGLHAGHAVVCVLLGFYLASTSLAPTIGHVVAAVLDSLGHIRF
ncbi:hypothetical protein [Streptomyces qinglanensis]|uniref:hypothetical protein n=1 Tax=Streptomyces qinglanensis TaxID=943816 RepID=UPI0037B97CDF